ncbi:MAG TPA: hypothetical protein QGH36_01335 [Candidatus Marinimicrobia bacterium]|jgi:hypothetical protein|nr:hypothetical protein [Candidatus Neomarinimicrobiota bacterium]|tara:strand:+ start:939 stop:1082 length:144 start_codon:yes stop_codon:yes gene_type:complete
MIKDDDNQYFRKIIDRKRPARSLLRTIALLGVILWLMFYLMKIASVG